MDPLVRSGCSMYGRCANSVKSQLTCAMFSFLVASGSSEADFPNLPPAVEIAEI